jgi:hypothetical protein
MPTIIFPEGRWIVRKTILTMGALLLVSLPTLAAQIIIGEQDSYSNIPWCVS